VCALLGFGAWYFLSSGRQVDKFKEFSPDGKFKILMPGIPKSLGESSRDGMAMKSWLASESLVEYAIMFADVPFELPPSALTVMVDAMSNRNLERIGAIYRREEPITLAGKYPGRYVEADLPGKDMMVKMRIFITKNRIYLVGCSGGRSWFASTDVAKFLDSFQLIGDQ
jgi:hypothetical protein